jgi:hypothetical protein
VVVQGLNLHHHYFCYWSGEDDLTGPFLADNCNYEDQEWDEECIGNNVKKINSFREINKIDYIRKRNNRQYNNDHAEGIV